MKKQLLIIGIIVILLTVGLSGCNEDNNTVQSDEDKIIGTWNFSGKYNNNTLNASYIFSSNKSFEVITSYIDKIYTSNGTWSITDNKLYIILEGLNKLTNYYAFSNDNTKLTLTNSSGNIVVFTKQLV